MAKPNEFRDQSVEELIARENDLRKEIFAMRNKHSQDKKLEKPHELRMKRKDLARLLTILREKELQQKTG
jgi:large subunit ribosomal protein L29